MSITIKFGQLLRQFVEDRETVNVNAVTVRECLNEVVQRYPAIEKYLFDRNGILMVLLLHNWVMVNQINLDQKVSEGDQLYIIPIIGGG